MSDAHRVALITGASRSGGLGIAIARAFAVEGYAVALAGGSNRAVLDQHAAELRAAGTAVHPALADLTDPAATRALVDGVLGALGRIDVLVCAASGRGDVPLLEMPLAEWRRVVGVNLDGTFNLVQAVAPHMIARGSGRIVTLTGISGEVADASRAHVVTAKAGLTGLTKAMARELGPHGITVNAVSPGIVDTPRSPGAGLQTRLERAAAAPLRRLGTQEEIAATCLFLASAGAAFITGQSIGVNGGARM